MQIKYIEMVAKRAEESYDVEKLMQSIRERDKKALPNLVDIPEWQLWIDHWGKTCQKFIAEFTKEGLTETALVFDEILNWHRENNEYIYKRIEENSCNIS